MNNPRAVNRPAFHISHESPQDGIDEACNSLAVCFFCIFHCFLDNVVPCFSHERDLVQAHPEEVPHVFLRVCLGIVREDPIEVSFPPDHARGDFVDKSLLKRRQVFAGEVTVERFVEEMTCLNPVDDRYRGGS